MNAGELLFMFIFSLFFMTGFLIVTNKNTPEETKAMLDDKEMWP